MPTSVARTRGARISDLARLAARLGCLDCCPHHHRRPAAGVLCDQLVVIRRRGGGSRPRRPGPAPRAGGDLGQGGLAGSASHRPGGAGPDHVRRHPSGARHRVDAVGPPSPPPGSVPSWARSSRGPPRPEPMTASSPRWPDRARRQETVTDPEVDGVLFVQLDGVPFPVLQWAVQSGGVPHHPALAGLGGLPVPRMDSPAALHHAGEPDGHSARHGRRDPGLPVVRP